MSKNIDLNALKLRLREFAEARDWDQLMYMDIQMPWLSGCKRTAHSPKNLSMALSAEVAEILEHLTNQGCFNVAGVGDTGVTQWLTEEQSKNLPKDKLDEVETELADTLIYLIRLADKLDIDLLTAAENKIEVNENKCPSLQSSLTQLVSAWFNTEVLITVGVK